MSVTATVTSDAPRQKVKLAFHQFLSTYFDGASHSVGMAAATPFPVIDISFEPFQLNAGLARPRVDLIAPSGRTAWKGQVATIRERWNIYEYVALDGTGSAWTMPTTEYTVSAVDGTAKKITVTGTFAPVAGSKVIVASGTGIGETYTVVSVTPLTGPTRSAIVVSEALAAVTVGSGISQKLVVSGWKLHDYVADVLGLIAFNCRAELAKSGVRIIGIDPPSTIRESNLSLAVSLRLMQVRYELNPTAI
jgi:hypothetical protein